MNPINAGLSRRATLGLGLAAAGTARAQSNDYPNRPVRIIVPYTPGGFTDLSARLVAEPLARALRQPVVVENRPGANSILGASVAAASPADGYTLVMVLPAHAANATLQAGKMPFDSIRSFAPVSVIATSPLVIAGARNIPPRNLNDFLAYARARPGALTYGSSGIGSTAHLAMELLQIRTGVRMVHAPYRGTQPALQDLIGGNIGAMFDVDSALRPQFQANTIVPLGLAAAQRAGFAPDLPTLGEQGLADFVVSTWSMLLAPAGTPAAIVTRLSAEIATILREPAMTARLLAMGLIAEGRNPEQTAELLRTEVERWASVIRTANVTVD